MNVTARALVIMDKTAQHVSQNDRNDTTTGKKTQPLFVVMIYLGHLFFNVCFLLAFYSRIPHLGQNYPEAVTQHRSLPSDPLQGLLEHH